MMESKRKSGFQRNQKEAVFLVHIERHDWRVVVFSEGLVKCLSSASWWQLRKLIILVAIQVRIQVIQDFFISLHEYYVIINMKYYVGTANVFPILIVQHYSKILDTIDKYPFVKY